jgi:hypothetical protein
VRRMVVNTIERRTKRLSISQIDAGCRYIGLSQKWPGARLALLAALLCGIASCSSDQTAAKQASFERPERMDFVCFDLSISNSPKPVPFSKCQVSEAKRNELKLVLHALVTQTSRGEVAAIDLSNNRVLDSRADIPGYTFIPVGVNPKAIVVPRNNPQTTYVADFGSRDIAQIPTTMFRSTTVGNLNKVSYFPLSGRPVDMVVSPDEESLFLAVPEQSAIVRLSICRNPIPEEEGGSAACASNDQIGEIYAAETLVLPSYDFNQINASIPAGDPSSASERTSYAYSCGYQFNQPEPSPLRDFSSLFACDGGVIDASNASATDRDAGEPAEAGAMDAQAGFDIDAALREAGSVADAGLGDDASGLAGDGAAAGSDASAAGGAQCMTIAPRPSALTIDKYGQKAPRLLIADRALPVIHIIELSRFSALASGQEALSKPIVVGVPTSDVVVSPPVPIALTPSSAANSGEPDVSESGAGVEDAGTTVETSDARAGDAGEQTAGGQGAGLQDTSRADAALITTDAGSRDGGNAVVTDGSAQNDTTAEASSNTAEMRADEVRYIYAIDATDGSVLAVNAETGTVVSVNSEGANGTDRIGLSGSVATSLEILTPGYSNNTRNHPFVSKCTCIKMEEFKGDPIAPDPTYLQGVFLAVSTADGSVRVVDIHDRRALDMRDCRHADCLTENNVQAKTSKNIPVNDFTNNVASWCSKTETCPSHVDAGLGINSSQCVTCCDQDGGIISLDTPNTACQKCQSETGEFIDFGDGSQCQKCRDEEGNPIAVAIRRNYARLAEVRNSGAPGTLVSFIADGRSYTLSAKGTVAIPETHSLITMECTGNKAKAFPSGTTKTKLADGGVSNEPFVCISTDPWAHAKENWSALYEGTIPGTAGSKGRFETTAGELTFSAETPFCSRGVMAGDLLVITSEPQSEDVINGAVADKALKNPSRFDPDDCAKLTKELASGAPARVAFEITDAFQNHLVIRNTMVNNKSTRPENLPSYGYAFVQFCMADMLMKFEVRTQNSYTVVGGGSQFLHEIYANPDDGNRCTDRATNPLLTGRARENELFENPTVAFKLAAQPAHPVGLGLLISITGVDKLGLNIGSYTSSYTVYGTLPVELRYNPANQILYAVDTAVRGVVEIPLSPFPANSSNGVYIN